MIWKIECEQHGGVNLLLRINDKWHYIYSKKNPIESGRKFYNAYYNGSGLYIIIGLGYFYHILPFIQNRDIDRLIIIEPDEELVELVKGSNIFKKLKSDSRVSLITGQPEIKNFTKTLKGAYNFLFYDRLNLLSYPPLERLLPEVYGALKNMVNSSLSELLNDGLTIAKFARRWILNLRKNIKELPMSYSLKSLKGNFSGSCIVAAAGPSLDIAIEKLKINNKRDYFIIAVDAAARPLILNRIVPDLVISLDPQFYIRFHFFDIERIVEDIPAILHPLVYNEVFKLFKIRYLYANKHPIFQSINGSNEMAKEDFNFQSVSSLSVKIAHYLGFNRIYFIGFDYAYSKYRSYAKDSFFYRHILLNSKRINSFLTQDVGFITKKLNKNSHGLTSEELNNYRLELEQLMVKLKQIDRGVEFYNFFSEGTRIMGCNEDKEMAQGFDYSFNKPSVFKKLSVDLNLLKLNDKSLVQTLALYYRLIKGLRTSDARKKSLEIYNNIFSANKNGINSATQ